MDTNGTRKREDKEKALPEQGFSRVSENRIDLVGLKSGSPRWSGNGSAVQPVFRRSEFTVRHVERIGVADRDTAALRLRGKTEIHEDPVPELANRLVDSHGNDYFAHLP